MIALLRYKIETYIDGKIVTADLDVNQDVIDHNGQIFSPWFLWANLPHISSPSFFHLPDIKNHVDFNRQTGYNILNILNGDIVVFRLLHPFFNLHDFNDKPTVFDIDRSKNFERSFARIRDMACRYERNLRVNDIVSGFDSKKNNNITREVNMKRFKPGADGIWQLDWD